MSEERKPLATPEDMALVAKTEADIKTEVEIFSFDISLMRKRIGESDPSQAFIQAHLDHVITCMVREAVPLPRFLDLDRAAFTQKLQLASALGLISLRETAPIKVVNTIRNKIAHKLDYVVSPEDEVKLRSSLPKHTHTQDDGTETTLFRILHLLPVIIDIQRQHLAFGRAMERKSVAYARVVLDEVGG